MIKQENKPFNDSIKHINPLKEEELKEKIKKKKVKQNLQGSVIRE
jgi:hypothetical protein